MIIIANTICSHQHSTSSIDSITNDVENYLIDHQISIHTFHQFIRRIWIKFNASIVENTSHFSCKKIITVYRIRPFVNNFIVFTTDVWKIILFFLFKHFIILMNYCYKIKFYKMSQNDCHTWKFKVNQRLGNLHYLFSNDKHANLQELIILKTVTYKFSPMTIMKLWAIIYSLSILPSTNNCDLSQMGDISTRS
jgi:hypothetical protein